MAKLWKNKVAKLGKQVEKLGKWNIGGKIIVFENMVTKLENFKI